MSKGERPEGSGIKSGYKYYNPMPQENRDKLSESLSGREIPWADKISQYYKDNPGMGTLKMHKAWDNSRHHLYELVDPDGVIHYTENLSEFCKEHGLRKSQMCRVAKGTRNHHRRWTCRYVYRYDGKTKQRIYY